MVLLTDITVVESFETSEYVLFNADLNKRWEREASKHSKPRKQRKNSRVSHARGTSLKSIGLDIVSIDNGRVTVKQASEAGQHCHDEHLFDKCLDEYGVIRLNENPIPVNMSPCTMNITPTGGNRAVAWFQSTIGWVSRRKDSSTNTSGIRRNEVGKNIKVTNAAEYDYMQDRLVSGDYHAYVKKYHSDGTMNPQWFELLACAAENGTPVNASTNVLSYKYKYGYQNFICVDIDSANALNRIKSLIDRGFPAPTLAVVNTNIGDKHYGHTQAYWGLTKRIPVTVEFLTKNTKGTRNDLNRKLTHEGRSYLRLFGAMNALFGGDTNYTPLFGRHRNPLSENPGNAVVLFEAEGQSYYRLDYLTSMVESFDPDGTITGQASENALNRNLQPLDRIERDAKTRRKAFRSKHLAASRIGNKGGDTRSRMYASVQERTGINPSEPIPEGERWNVASLIVSKAPYYGLDMREELDRLTFETGRNRFTKKDRERVIKAGEQWLKKHPLDPTLANGYRVNTADMCTADCRCAHVANASRCAVCASRPDAALIGDASAGSWYRRRARAHRREVIESRRSSNSEYALYLGESSRGGKSTYERHGEEVRATLKANSEKHNDRMKTTGNENMLRVLFNSIMLVFTMRAWYRHEEKTGNGFLSRHGYASFNDWLDHVSPAVRAEYQRLLDMTRGAMYDLVGIKYVENIDTHGRLNGAPDGDGIRIMLDNYTGIGQGTKGHRARRLTKTRYYNMFRQWYALLDSATDDDMLDILRMIGERTGVQLLPDVRTVDTVCIVDNAHDENIADTVDNVHDVDIVDNEHNVDDAHNAHDVDIVGNARYVHNVGTASIADNVNNARCVHSVDSAGAVGNVSSDFDYAVLEYDPFDDDEGFVGFVDDKLFADDVSGIYVAPIDEIDDVDSPFYLSDEERSEPGLC